MGLNVDTKNCARCGGDHPALEYRPLTRPHSPPEVFWAWEYWAPCPTNGEPIMLSVSWAYLTNGPGETDRLLPPDGTWYREFADAVDKGAGQ